MAETRVEQAVLRLLAEELRGTAGPASALNRRHHHRVFEACAALKLGLLMWAQLPLDALEARGIRPRGVPDCRVDCASPDLSVAARVEWGGPGQDVTFAAVATFAAFAGRALGATRLVFVRGVGMGLRPMVDRLDEVEQLTLGDAEIDAFAERARGLGRPGARRPGPVADGGALAAPAGKEETNDQAACPQPEGEAPALKPHQVDAVDRLVAAVEQASDGADADSRTVRALLAYGSGVPVVVAEFLRRWDHSEGHYLVLAPSPLARDQVARRVTDWSDTMRVARILDTGLAPAAEGFSVAVGALQCLSGTLPLVGDIEWDLVLVVESHSVDAAAPGAEAGEWRRQLRALPATRVLLSEALPAGEKRLAVRFGLEEAVAAGCLVDFAVTIPVFPGPADDDRLLALAGLVASRPEWTRPLCFATDAAVMRRFAGLLAARGVPAACYDGSAAVRQRAVRLFREGGVRALVAAGALEPGLDISAADTCVFVGAAGAPPDVVLCASRVLRPCLARGKQLAFVVLPSSSDEDALVRALRALAEHDARVAASLRDRRAGRVDVLAYRADALVLEGAEEAAPEPTGELFERVCRLALPRWDAALALLARYAERQGTMPDAGTAFEGEPLGAWTAQQRESYASGMLSATQVAALEAVPGWLWVTFRGAFAEHFECYRKFVARKGRQPKQLELSGGWAIGQWCSNLRAKAKDGTLDADKRAALERLGWAADAFDAKWNHNCARLAAFVEAHGRLPKATETLADGGPTLGEWTRNQRGEMRKLDHGSLSDDRVARLTAIFAEW